MIYQIKCDSCPNIGKCAKCPDRKDSALTSQEIESLLKGVY